MALSPPLLQAKYRVRHNGRDDYSAPVNQALHFDQWGLDPELLLLRDRVTSTSS